MNRQTLPADSVVVVDNASTDGTWGWLESQMGLSLLRLESNVGGSGGFVEGIKKAHASGASHFWLLDDDTMPTPTALERLVSAVSMEDLGFACSLVLWTDGTPHLMNNPQILGGETWFHTVLQQPRIPARSASFVSLLVSAKAVEDCGLPCREMFLWYDDAEFTTRVTKRYPGWLVLDSIVVHETATNSFVDIRFLDSTNWHRYVHGIRNMMAYSRLYGPNRRSYFLLTANLLVGILRRMPALGLKATTRLLGSWAAGLTFHPKPETLQPSRFSSSANTL